MRICLCIVSDSSHSHTLPITCTCNAIKGTQDLKICSHAESLVLVTPLDRNYYWLTIDLALVRAMLNLLFRLATASASSECPIGTSARNKQIHGYNQDQGAVTIKFLHNQDQRAVYDGHRH